MSDLQQMIDECSRMVDELPSAAEHKAAIARIRELEAEAASYKRIAKAALTDIADLQRQLAQERKERRAVVEALEPFADVDGEGDEDFDDDTKVEVRFGRTTHYALRLGDFRRARAALFDSLPLGVQEEGSADAT
jgi:hypothetical protein